MNPRRLRVMLWCELLKALLESRPVTLLERSGSPRPTNPVQLRLI